MPQNLFHNLYSSETGDMIFARLDKILNKEEGNSESLTAGPTCQVLLPPTETKFAGDFSARASLRPNRGHQLDPSTLVNRLTPFSLWQSH